MEFAPAEPTWAGNYTKYVTFVISHESNAKVYDGLNAMVAYMSWATLIVCSGCIQLLHTMYTMHTM